MYFNRTSWLVNACTSVYVTQNFVYICFFVVICPLMYGSRWLSFWRTLVSSTHFRAMHAEAVNVVVNRLLYTISGEVIIRSPQVNMTPVRYVFVFQCFQEWFARGPLRPTDSPENDRFWIDVPFDKTFEFRCTVRNVCMALRLVQFSPPIQRLSLPLEQTGYGSLYLYQQIHFCGTVFSLLNGSGTLIFNSASGFCCPRYLRKDSGLPPRTRSST